MIPKHRLSIARLMAIVSFIAIDIAVVRGFYLARIPPPRPSPGYLAIVLPMANLLLFFAPRVRDDRAGRWFWVGFEAVGWVVIAILGYWDQHRKDLLFLLYEWLFQFQFYPLRSPEEIAMSYSFFVIVHTPPQLLLAWLGGRLASWAAARGSKEGDASPLEDSGR